MTISSHESTRGVKDLPARMRERAAQQVEHSAELLSMAYELEAAYTAPIPKLVGTWARVRKRWCEITGEPLV